MTIDLKKLSKEEIKYLRDKTLEKESYIPSLEDAIDEITEIIADFEDLDDESLIEVRDIILERAEKVSIYLQELDW